jgi:hypothetical protein
MTKQQIIEYIQSCVLDTDKAIDGFKRLNGEGIDCKDVLATHRGRRDAMVDILATINK